MTGGEFLILAALVGIVVGIAAMALNDKPGAFARAIGLEVVAVVVFVIVALLLVALTGD